LRRARGQRGVFIFVSAVFRRSDWEEVNGFDRQMVYGWEDYDFWLSLIELGRDVHCIPELLFFYRKHGVILRERPDLWNEFANFIQGAGEIADARLQLAWDVVQELAPIPKTLDVIDIVSRHMTA
jgi:hypothetical protein